MYIQFTKDINKIKDRIIFGLGLREIIIGAMTIGSALGVFFLLKGKLPNDVVYYLLIPIILLGMFFMIYKHNGMTFEKFIYYKLRRILFSQKILHYETEGVNENAVIRKTEK